MRDECLNEHLFSRIEEARRIIEAWRIDYNAARPHTSLGGLTPMAYATQRAESLELLMGSAIRPVASPSTLDHNPNRPPL